MVLYKQQNKHQNSRRDAESLYPLAHRAPFGAALRHSTTKPIGKQADTSPHLPDHYLRATAVTVLSDQNCETTLHVCNNSDQAVQFYKKNRLSTTDVSLAQQISSHNSHNKSFLKELLLRIISAHLCHMAIKIFL